MRTGLSELRSSLEKVGGSLSELGVEKCPGQYQMNNFHQRLDYIKTALEDMCNLSPRILCINLNFKQNKCREGPTEWSGRAFILQWGKYERLACSG